MMFLFKRIESLRVFTGDFMLATNLAAQGLDIEKVKTVSKTNSITLMTVLLFIRLSMSLCLHL